MQRFHDDNTLEDIMGCYLVASYWSATDTEVDIDRKLAEFVERIEDKLKRNRNKVRHNWFTIALDYAQQAHQQYRDNQVERGRRLLRLAWEHLESGNKASRRKKTFVAGSDGEIRHVSGAG
jgi:hypothetical protein